MHIYYNQDMPNKRLFLFAGYNKSGLIDDALVYYLKHLSSFGDIILVMDSDCPSSELKKAQKYCVYTSAIRHGEYDFGSYKRAFNWATKNLNISDYDLLYLVNDSVYGPLYDMGPYFKQMESGECDAFGIVKNPHRHHPHIQSWFVGLRKNIFFTTWFDTFMRDITKLESKGAITRKYEHGLSKLISNHGHKWRCLYTVAGRGVYNHIKRLYKSGMPFMKKVAFTRTHGALGRQILYVLNHTSTPARDAIYKSATDAHGTAHINWLLTRNPIRVMTRRIHHALYKLFNEGI